MSNTNEELLTYLREFGRTIDYECKDVESTLALNLMASAPSHRKIGKQIGFLYIARQVLTQIKKFCDAVPDTSEDEQITDRGEDIVTRFIDSALQIFESPDGQTQLGKSVMEDFPAADIPMIEPHYAEGAEICEEWLRYVNESAAKPDIIPPASQKPPTLN